MLECKHKTVTFITNELIQVEMCHLYNKPVNDAICKRCPDRCGEFLKKPEEYNVPRRSDKELDIIQQVCEGCPLFHQVNNTCRKIVMPVPTTTMAQNPANHCPEGKW